MTIYKRRRKIWQKELWEVWRAYLEIYPLHVSGKQKEEEVHYHSLSKGWMSVRKGGREFKVDIKSLDEVIAVDDNGKPETREERIEDKKSSLEDLPKNLAIEQAMKKLSKRQRECIELSIEERLTQKEIASKLGISQQKVSEHIKVGSKKMKEDLAKVRERI